MGFVCARGALNRSTAFSGGFRPGQLLGKEDGLDDGMAVPDHSTDKESTPAKLRDVMHLGRLTAAGQLSAERPELRFTVGSRVECSCSTHPDNFHPGGRTVLQAFLYGKTIC